MLNAKEIATMVAKAADSKKAENIIILDVGNLLGITNYFVVCEGKTGRQSTYISDFIQEKLREKKIKPIGIEGEDEGGWILLDYGSVVVHIFTTEVRQYYQLERLWKDAPRLEWEEDLEQRA